MFYRGQGTDFSPDVPFVDQALSQGLARMGFTGSRKKGEGIFAAVRESHARGYAGEAGEGMFSVVPLPGATVTWVEGSTDLVLEFGAWLRSAAYDVQFAGRIRPFLRDVQGDVNVFDTYISLKRQAKAVAAVVDAFLSELDVREVAVEDGRELSIGGHDGEVWITGPCALEPIVPGESFTAKC